MIQMNKWVFGVLLALAVLPCFAPLALYRMRLRDRAEIDEANAEKDSWYAEWRRVRLLWWIECDRAARLQRELDALCPPEEEGDPL